MIGALLGLSCALGVLIVSDRLKATAQPTMMARIAPRLGVPSGVSIDESPLASISGLVSGAGTSMLRFLPFVGTQKSLEKIAQAGRSTGNDSSDLTRFRIEQMTWIGSGLIAGTLFGLWNVLRGSSPVAILITIVLGVTIAALVHDKYVSHLARKRVASMDQQFPDIAELLAFSVTAGETPLAALARVAGMSSGALSSELNLCVRDIRSGDSLASALRAMALRTGSRNVERFTDGLVIAMERGTPLSEVLRAQAADARNQQRQHLIELAGKKDVAMLVPVVFFVLPTVIVIALFPAMRGLQVLVP
jgi:tight adherence protein C